MIDQTLKKFGSNLRNRPISRDSSGMRGNNQAAKSGIEGNAGAVPSSLRQADDCPECQGWGQFWTRNRDGRFGSLYPATLPCPDCGGDGRR